MWVQYVSTMNSSIYCKQQSVTLDICVDWMFGSTSNITQNGININICLRFMCTQPTWPSKLLIDLLTSHDRSCPSFCCIRNASGWEKGEGIYLVNVFSHSISFFFLPTKNISWDLLWVYSNSGFCIVREYIDIFICCTDSPSQAWRRSRSVRNVACCTVAVQHMMFLKYINIFSHNTVTKSAKLQMRGKSLCCLLEMSAYLNVSFNCADII